MSRIRNSTDKTVANSLSRELSTMARLPSEYSTGTPLYPAKRLRDPATMPFGWAESVQDANVIANAG